MKTPGQTRKPEKNEALWRFEPTLSPSSNNNPSQPASQTSQDLPRVVLPTTKFRSEKLVHYPGVADFWLVDHITESDRLEITYTDAERIRMITHDVFPGSSIVSITNRKSAGVHHPRSTNIVEKGETARKTQEWKAKDVPVKVSSNLDQVRSGTVKTSVEMGTMHDSKNGQGECENRDLFGYTSPDRCKQPVSRTRRRSANGWGSGR